MTTLNLVVSADEDDAYWAEGNSFFSNASTSLYVGYYNDSYKQMNSFLRFLNVTLGQGDTIDAATYQLRSSEAHSETVHVIISAIDAANAAAPTTYSEAENAIRTAASVTWNNVPAWTSSGWYTSLEIKAIIQEIVDIGGWSSGNALVIYVEDNGTPEVSGYVRRAVSHDSVMDYPPKLNIDYTAGAPAGQPIMQRGQGIPTMPGARDRPGRWN